MTTHRYAIIGTGAIGGYYGAHLHQAGFDVRFLLHRDYEHVNQHGLVIHSREGDLALPEVKAYADTHSMPPVDVVVIALKTTQNHRLPDLLKPILGPNTVLLTLQNGFGIEDDWQDWIGSRVVLGGVCFICANKVGPGTIHHLDYGNILLGEYNSNHLPAGVSPLLTHIAEDFRRAKITAETTADLRLARWRKLAWNIPFNGLSVVLNATTDEMMQDPNSCQLAEQLIAEVVEAARQDGESLFPGQGRHLPEQLVPQMLAHTAQMTPYRTSMKIDFDEGRPLEVEAIVGNPLRTAQAVGASVPKIEMLYHQLKAIDRRLARTNQS